MEQFHRFKQQHPDAVLFFRMGDFYETFYEDAKTCARVLGLTLTSRSKDSNSKEWGVIWELEYPAAVTWDDAIAFANWLSEREELTPVYSGKGKTMNHDPMADGYRLLTEAEWEYAARAAGT